MRNFKNFGEKYVNITSYNFLQASAESFTLYN